MGGGVPMDQGNGPCTPGASESHDEEASTDVKIQDALLESGIFDLDELEQVEIERARESAADKHSEEALDKPSQLPQVPQLPHIWGLRFGDDADDVISEWHQTSRDGTMALVKEELELEAEAERRRRPAGKVLRGIEGRKIVIPITWNFSASAGRQQSKNAGADGKPEQDPSFCELLFEGLIRMYKLLSSVTERTMQSVAGAWTLRPRLIALELLLARVVPGHFTLEALQHCERILTLLAHPDRSLYASITAALQPRAPGSKVRSLFSQAFSILKDLEDEVIQLAGCVLDATEAVLEAIDAAKDVVLAARDMTPELAEVVYKAKYAFGHHLFTGDVIILRTDAAAISCLLYDLRAGFQTEEFQNRYKELRSKARQSGGAHAEMVHLTFTVQQSVLPRYGFPPTAAGVQAMRKESGMHADGIGGHMSCSNDKVVAKLRRDIHMCLDMDVKKHARLPLFHTVGDSHSMFGWPESVIQHAQGPLLCYNVDRVDLSKLDPPISMGDAVCLCFGEIDCRCHVHKHVTAEKKYQEVIDEIIDRYFNYLESQIKLLPAGVKIFVYNVPPPVRRCDTEENKAYPYLGQDEERQAYVLYFNEKLKKACQKTSVRFFDVYDQYVDEEGFLSKEYSDGNVHIADGMWIEEVIHQLQLRPFRPSEINFDN